MRRNTINAILFIMYLLFLPVLLQNLLEIDAFGPMDNKKGNNFAKDVTMRRKPSVKVPTMTYDPNEWDTFSIDDVSGLGTHIVD